MSIIQFHKSTALEFMRAMPDRSVDVAIFDPPYDEKTHDGALNAEDIDFTPIVDFEHVTEALRVTKRWVICFCALEQLGAYQAKAGDAWVRAGIWVRHSGPQKTGDRPGQAAEGIAIMHPEGKKRWNGGGKAAIWEASIVTARGRLHPTQKPVFLMEMLIRDFTETGETVLDCFAGSGTTGVAAVSEGRRFIGCEATERYFAVANRRLNACREQLTISYEPPRPKRKVRTKQLAFTLEATNGTK